MYWIACDLKCKFTHLMLISVWKILNPARTKSLLHQADAREHCWWSVSIPRSRLLCETPTLSSANDIILPEMLACFVSANKSAHVTCNVWEVEILIWIHRRWWFWQWSINDRSCKTGNFQVHIMRNAIQYFEFLQPD